LVVVVVLLAVSKIPNLVLAFLQPCPSRKVNTREETRYSRKPYNTTTTLVHRRIQILTMAGFFDIKARKEAAITNGSTSKAPDIKQSTRMQPCKLLP